MTPFLAYLALGAAAVSVPIPPELRYLGTLGAGGIIAGVTMFYYRQDRLSSEKAHEAAEARMETLTSAVIAALGRNSETQMRLATLIEMDRHTRAAG